MDVHYLEVGEQAPDDGDKVTIHKLPSGKAGYAGSVRTGSATNNFVHANNFDTEEAAEREALAIARDRGATLLYVERPHA